MSRLRGFLACVTLGALASCAGSATAAPAPSPLVLMFLDKPILASPHAHWVTAVAFSPDGSVVATGADDGLVRLWDTGSGLLRSIGTEDAQRGVSAIAFSPDGRTVAAVGGALGADVLLWDAATGRKTGETPSPPPPQGTADYMEYKGRPITISTVTSVAYSPDGSVLATGGSGGVQLRVPATGALRSVLGPAGVRVSAVVFSGDGATLAAACSDGRVRLWSMPAGTLKATLAGPNQPLNDVGFSPDGLWVAAVSAGSGSFLGLGAARGGALWVWSLPGTRVKHVSIEAGVARKVVFVDAGRLVVAAGAELVSVDALSADAVPQELWSHSDEVLALAASPDGRFVLSGSKDRTADLLDWRAGRLVKRLPGLVDIVSSLAVSSDGRTYASATLDNRFSNWFGSTAPFEERRVTSFSGRANEGRIQPSDVRIWSASDGSLLRLLPLPSAQVTAVTFLPGSPLLAVAGWVPGKGGQLSVWDSSDGRLVQELTPGRTEVLSVAASPDGRLVASGDGDGRVGAWDVKGAREVWSQRIGTRALALAFAPAGAAEALLAAADGSGTVRLLEAATGRTVRTLPGRFPVASLAFSPDGATLTAGRSDAGIVVWRLDSSTPPRTVRAPGDYFAIEAGFVAFSSDGAVIAAGGHGKDVALFDARTLALRKELRGHAHAPTAAAFLPDGRLLTAGQERSIILWQQDPGAILATWVFLPADPSQGWPDEWVGYTPRGEYAGSASLDRLYGWILGGETFPVDAGGAMHRVDRLLRE